MEHHFDRNGLAKEIAVIMRLKNELGIKELQLELSSEIRDETLRLAKFYQMQTSMNRVSQKMYDGTDPQSKNISAAQKINFQKNLEEYQKNVQKFLDATYNMAILIKLAKVNGITVTLMKTPDDPLYRKNDSELTTHEFAMVLKLIDKALLKGLDTNPKHSRILVSGMNHGKAVSEGKSAYAVIPITLVPKGTYSLPLQAEQKRLKAKIASGKELTDEEDAIIDDLSRTSFGWTKPFQSGSSVGASGIAGAIEKAAAVVPGLKQPPKSFWKEMETGLAARTR